MKLLYATRYKKKTITEDDAADRDHLVLLEQRWKIQNKKIIAYHEVGHAIVGSVLENHDEVEK
jgi:cell division protease FtsH